MKKTIFKKSMSVFLACLMLLSCWVFVAPTKAEAANVSYPVTIRFQFNTSSISGHIKVYYFSFKSDGSGFDTTQTNLYKIVINSYSGEGYNQTGTIYNAGPFNITEGWPWKVEIRAESGTTVRF